MALTRDFKDTVRTRFQTDPEFREALLMAGLEAMRSGVDPGQSLKELICVFSPSDIEELRDTGPRCSESE